MTNLKRSASPARPKVLVYVPHGAIPDKRGFSPSIVACELAQRTSSFRLSLVCLAEQDQVGPAEWEGFPLVRLPPRRLYARLRKLGFRPGGRTVAPQFLAVCQRTSPALLHVHQLEFDIKEFSRRFGRSLPTLLHAHVLTHKASSSRGLADRYIAVSDYVAKNLADMGYPSERVVVLRNGVDTALFAPPDALEAAAAKERLGVSPDTPVLAFVGRKHDVKGYPAFLAVAERLLATDRPLLILAIGANPERPSGESGYVRSRERERRLVADSRFRSLPALPQRTLARVYHGIDVTLLPSLAEPQGMVMIESLAAGCVTISTRVGGVGETLQHGATGFLVDDPYDTDALYGCATQVLDRLPALSPLREAARAFALAHLDWSVTAARLEALYESTVSR